MIRAQRKEWNYEGLKLLHTIVSKLALILN